MQGLNSLGQQIFQTLRTQLIPWASGSSPFVLLDAPPKTIGQFEIQERPGKKLPRHRGLGQKVRMQFWLEEHLNSMSVPYMGCVVEGTADIVVGTTTAMCRSLNIPGKKWIITMPQRTFFIAPPQVPLSGGNGDRVHWEGAHPENAYAKIFWMQFHTTGVHCHFCTSQNGKHWTHPYYFIPHQELLPLSESLIQELNHQDQFYLSLLYLKLSTILNLMARSMLKTNTGELEELASRRTSLAATQSTDDLMQQAIRFIDEHIDDRELCVQKIADHVQLSAQHFARLFSRTQQTSVMEFVTKRRMQVACELLKESDFHVRRIALHTGYATSAAFIKAFERHIEMTPSQYRQQAHSTLVSENR